MSERKRPGLMARLKASFDPDQWRQPPDSFYSYRTPGQFVPGYGIGLRSYLAVYRTQPAVRQVVAFIAENMAQVPLKAYERVSDVERRALTDHPVSALLASPNPSLSQFTFIRDLVTDLEVFDTAYWQVAKSGKRLAVRRLYPDAVEPVGVDAFGAPSSYRVHKADGSYEDLDPTKVVHLRGWGNASGISPMETLRRVLAEDEAAGSYREGMYRNGMRNAGVIERPLEAPDWSDKARDRFLDDLTNRFTGDANSGRPLLLEEGMTWKSDQIAMASQEYIESRQFTVRAVANLYRISPAILGLSDAPFASITAYNQQLYQNALAPRLTFITQELERQLFLPDERPRFYLEFNLQAKLRGSFQEQAAIAQAAVGGPFMTVDEYRALNDLPPLSDEDRALLMPAPVAPGPAPTGAAETDQPAPSEQPLNEPKRARKAADRGVVKRRKQYAEEATAVVSKTFDRILSQQAKGGTYSKARYGAEVSKDLRPLLERVVVTEASRKATQLGGTFDPKQVQHYLDAKAQGAGDNIARAAEREVDRLKDDPEHAKQNLSSIAQRVGLSLATSLVAFARQEAAKQTGATHKTWTVISDDSRHPELDNETVKVGQEFSNGLQYPGDPAGDPAETAGCECVLDVS